MSVARGLGQNGGRLYSNITMPADIELNFTVDATNGNGLGVRSIKSNGYVRNVFMHTSATPGPGEGMTNPNPAVGFILLQMKQNFNYALSGSNSIVSPIVSPTTSTNSGMTVGQAYVITVLGTTTLAEWQGIGLPAGLTPTVGQSFIALTTGTGGSHTGKVGLPGVSGVTLIETVGDPNQSISNSAIASNGGAFLLLQCLGATSSSVTTLIPTAPANNSVIALRLRWDRSTVSIPDGGNSNSAGSGGL
jgi:hypothetical protein